MMKKRAVSIIIALIMTVLMLTGCGNQLPEMDEEQIQMVGDYAAGLLLKYDASYRSRLVDLPMEETPASQKENLTSEESKQPSEEAKGGMAPVDDTPVIPIGGETAEVNNVSLEDCLNLPEGIRVTYQGERTASTYPDNAQDDVFALDATAGNRLLILSFLIENQLDQDQEINVFQNNPVFRITVNDNVSKNSLMTMLPDELSTYIGTIAANSSVEAVLIMEINEADAAQINTITLNIKNASEKTTIQLK